MAALIAPKPRPRHCNPCHKGMRSSNVPIMLNRFLLLAGLAAGLAAGAAATGTLITRPDLLAARLHDSMPGPFAADVVEVVDGDTLEVRVQIWLGQDVITRVRMTGIDTPELRGKCPAEKAMAQAAKEMLARLVADGGVVLRDVSYDKYGGRVLAVVSTRDGRNLAELLIAAGLARPYGGTARAGWC